MLDYFCANSNFNRLNGSKEQSPKLLIKGIQVDNICKTTTFSKLMRSVVSFKMSPITSKTKIAFAVGFKDSGYFSKCFRKKYDQTPREYMNEWRKG